MESEGSPEWTNYVHRKANAKIPQMTRGELKRHKLFRETLFTNGLRLNKQRTYNGMFTDNLCFYFILRLSKVIKYIQEKSFMCKWPFYSSVY